MTTPDRATLAARLRAELRWSNHPDTDALLNEAADALDAMAWQPMATAPKDGTWVLLWWPYWSRHPFTAHWYPVNGPNGYWDALNVPCDLPDGDPGPIAWCALPVPATGPQEREG